MKQLLIISFVTCQFLFAQGAHFSNNNTSKQCKLDGLYYKTFGKSSDEPVIFLHGGPGYNCANFEGTTAQKLADNGFYVIVYDRRGEGRSSTMKADFTQKQTVSDIKSLMKCHRLKSAHLIGHSFGGIVATWFAKTYPKETKSIVLVGAPVSLQESFKTITASCKTIYASKNDSTGLQYMAMLDKMDPTTMDYASYCFYHAMQNGFYSPKNPSEETKKIYQEFGKSPLFKEAMQMTAEAPKGFSKNEKYTTIDLSADLKSFVANGMKVYGLYGKEDGLYSEKQIMDLKNILADGNLLYLDNCSHNVFVDQQEKFIETLKTRCK
jgi:proline iminopeptidase